MEELCIPEAAGNEGLASLELHVLPPLPRHKERERRCAMEHIPSRSRFLTVSSGEAGRIGGAAEAVMAAREDRRRL